MRKTLSRLAIALGGLIAVVAASYGYYRLPFWLDGSTLAALPAKEEITAATAIRGQFTPWFTVGLALLALIYPARTYRLEQDKRFTDRFNAAIGHLSSEQSITRVGGIWALQRIMQDSPRDRERVRRTLTVFLQEATRGTPEIGQAPQDVSTALEVLRTQPWATALNLTGVRVPQADMHEMHLSHGQLDELMVRDGNLRKVQLRDADLAGANFIGAKLYRADFTAARAQRLKLAGADLTKAWLVNADLRKAIIDADTSFTGANLSGTDLREAIGLTAEHLANATISEDTKLPDELMARPIGDLGGAVSD